jgi:site-specific recombinase XerD
METSPIAGDPTVAQILAWHESNPSRKVSSPTAEKERRRIWGLLRDALGNQPIPQCKAFQALNFINGQTGVKSDASRRRWNAAVQAPFNAAERLQLISRNPFKGVSFPAGPRGRDWTDDEYRAMLRGSTAVFRRVLVFLRFSGMRPGEGRELQQLDVRTNERKIVVEKHKMRYLTKAPRPVPLNHVLTKLVAWLKRNHPSSRHLLLNSHGRPWTSQAITKRLRKLREMLGLSREVKLHGARHTFITRALMNGVDPAALMQVVGHTQMATLRGYAHLTNKVDHLLGSMDQAIAGPRAKKGVKTKE